MRRIQLGIGLLLVGTAMHKILMHSVVIVLGLVAVAFGYALERNSFHASIAAARSSTMPAHPLILYLAPAASPRGAANTQTMQARGAAPVNSWAAAQKASLGQAIDAIVVDGTLLPSIAASDLAWLRQQFSDGVVIVAIGSSEPVLAPELGFKTLKDPNEVEIAHTPTSYMLVNALLLGQPDDVKTYSDAHWLDLVANSQLGSVQNIKGPTSILFGRVLGQVDTNRDIELLFTRINGEIQGVYNERADFQSRLAQWQNAK